MSLLKRVNFWHPVPWVAFYLLTMAGVIMNEYWSEWAVQYRERVADDLRIVAYDIDYVLSYTPREWLPWPWEPGLSLEQNAVNVATAIKAKYPELKYERMSNANWERFQLLVSHWDARRRICEIIARLGTNAQTCANAHKLPQAWLAHFKARFDQHYYMVANRYGMHFGRRVARQVEYCNVSPTSTVVTAIDIVASDAVSNFYRIAIDHQQASWFQQPIATVAPGQCIQRLVRGYDVTPESVFHARPENPAQEAWFFQQWSRHHATWLNDAKERSKLVAYARQSVEAHLCINARNQGWVTLDFDQQHCADADKRPFEAAMTSGSDLFYATNYPGFSGYAQYFAGASHIDRRSLNDMLSLARELGKIVNLQYARYQDWRDRSPRFLLGAHLRDANGPFEIGVSAMNLPRETLYGEVVDIPSSGELMELNGMPVYSVEDVYYALTQHGDSFGIEKLLALGIYTPHSNPEYATYKTRFRFNESVKQRFDMSVSGLEIGIHSAAFNSGQLMCWLQSLSDMNDYSSTEICAWFETQRMAYARQVNPEHFESSSFLGELAGMLIVPGSVLKSTRWLNGGRRLNLLSRVVMGGVSEGVTHFGYAFNDGPPSLDFATRFESGVGSARIGFLFGSTLGALLR